MNAARLGLQVIDIHFGAFDFTLCALVGSRLNAPKYAAWKLDAPRIADEDLGDRRGWCVIRRGRAPILWIPRKPRSPAEHATLAHEALHAVRYMLVDWVEMEFTSDTDEAFCHSLGFVVREILRRAK